MILMNNISKNYGLRKVLSNISINIKEGEFVSIIGPSGSGKTTILNLIALLDEPDQGTITINEIENPKKKDIVYLRRYILGYIFQNYALIDNETVMQNLLLSKPYNKEFDNKLVENTLIKVGLDVSVTNKKIYQLSGGEQQKVSIARVILKPCKIVLADEPTGNLDEGNKRKIIELFKDLKSMGKTIVCVTHDKSMAANSDRIVELSSIGIS